MDLLEFDFICIQAFLLMTGCSGGGVSSATISFAQAYGE